MRFTRSPKSETVRRELPLGSASQSLPSWTWFEDLRIGLRVEWLIFAQNLTSKSTSVIDRRSTSRYSLLQYAWQLISYVIGWSRCLCMWRNKMDHDLEGLIGENRKKHNYSRYWQGERERQIISAQVPAAPRELGSNTTNCFKSGKDSKRPAFRKTSVRKPVAWTSLHVQSR